MKKYRLLLLFFTVFFLTTQIVGQSAARPIDNPQNMMVGAKFQSLGGTNPVLEGDIGGIFANPAVLGGMESSQFIFSSQKILNAFDYTLLGVSYPLDFKVPFTVNNKRVKQRIVLGLSYGGVGLQEIPETIEANGVGRQIGSFNSGFNLYAGSAGTTFYDLFGVNSIAVGTSFKIYNQYLGSESRSTFGMDFGAIGTYHMQYLFVDQVHLGLTVLNLLSGTLEWSDNGDTATIPAEFYLGAGVDMFGDMLSVYANNTVDGFALSSEVRLGSDIYLRGSTNLNKMNLGTGIKLKNVAGVGDQALSLRIDYNFTMNPDPVSDELTQALTFTVLGESRPFAPSILEPNEDFLTGDNYVDLNGVGPKNTAVRIFNNKSLVRTAMTDKYGKWRYKGFPLKEGNNEVFLQSYSIDEDSSQDSDKLNITVDTIPPTVALSIFPEGDYLEIQAKSQDDIVDMTGDVDGEEIRFTQIGETEVWRSLVPMPENLKNGRPIPDKYNFLEVVAVDQAGNQSQISEVPFFVKLTYPTDRFVHFQDKIRLIGAASPMVKRIKFRDNPVYIDPEFNFSFQRNLNPGKNIVRMTVETLNDRQMNYNLKILFLKTYPDLVKGVRERREIEFMTTLGVLHGDEDGNFRPYAPVTRMYITKLMAIVTNLKVNKDAVSVFPDVSSDDPGIPYILAGIENGSIFAYPDGTFRPNQPLTFDEVIEFLSSAGIMNDEEVEEGSKIMERRELAQVLSYQPKYERAIEEMVDWDKGYDDL